MEEIVKMYFTTEKAASSEVKYLVSLAHKLLNANILRFMMKKN